MSPEEKQFWDEVERLTKPTDPIEFEYRLYYNKQGDIVVGTMIKDQPVDVDCPYLTVSKEDYEQYYNYYVKDGALKKFESDSKHRINLILSDSGYATVANHASLLIEEKENYSTITYYAYRNH